MSRRPRRAALAFALVLGLTGSAVAQTATVDPAASRAQLLQGFELKKQGRFAEALPHLVESVHLDPSNPKALLNLADCEEQLHSLVAAQSHWVTARDRAAEQSDDVIRDEATRRLAALDARIPKLVVKLAPGAPSDTRVARDGVTLGAVSLGTALPADPGKHTVDAHEPGFSGRTFEIVLEEGRQAELVVDPGAPEAGSGASPAAPISRSASTGSSRPGPLRTAGWVTGGVGLAGVVAGVAFGIAAIVQKNQADCPQNVCSRTSASEHDDALTSAHLSTAFLIGGTVVAATGATLWLLAPRSPTGAGPALGFAGSTWVLRETW
jgi:hypothetical protein